MDQHYLLAKIFQGHYGEGVRPEVEEREREKKCSEGQTEKEEARRLLIEDRGALFLSTVDLPTYLPASKRGVQNQSPCNKYQVLK